MDNVKDICRVVPPTKERRQRTPIDDGALRLAAENPKANEHSCALLQLPVDILLLVVDELEPPHRLAFAHTCRALHNLHRPVPLLRDQHLEYLACVARSRPEQWVCEVCVTFHPAVTLDTPEQPQLMTCPHGWLKRRCLAYSLGDWPVDSRHLKIDHRHVQLALKYLRLGIHHEYVQKLLAPHRQDDFKTHLKTVQQRNVLKTRYSVHPKAAAGADGHLRYLTLSVWLYQRDHHSVSLEAMGNLWICPHLSFVSRFGSRSPIAPNDQFGAAIETALAQDDHSEMRGACDRCATDFSVQASPDRAELRVWQDLGPECSPRSLAWRTHLRESCTTYFCPQPRVWGSALHHEPGSVRALYDCAAEDLNT
ncbi:hypothetical protein CONLIGDRAFT_79093 [Coniochaeta ligniaria NRRL 30616]|uniref:F-box domain-containing protein n=1 Tax=Coniochaeta ligniaria NRRL 30616 TaxID=1408157 RepID=A0A1J7J798_9PEZI|nr:hypothetical protein CONLIGDRAFT_79093 [Coniochaeta ligniaria NRRL 30616]